MATKRNTVYVCMYTVYNKIYTSILYSIYLPIITIFFFLWQNQATKIIKTCDNISMHLYDNTDMYTTRHTPTTHYLENI